MSSGSDSRLDPRQVDGTLESGVRPSLDKLRGGFYTPPNLVDACWRRVRELSGTPATVLEPSCGDGAFVRGFRGVGTEFTCVELVGGEAAKCRESLLSQSLPGRVVDGSFFEWAADAKGGFDALVGNPPFVGYHDVRPQDRVAAEKIMSRIGEPLPGVASLWIPFVCIGMSLLRDGGAFAMVVPHELLCISSAQVVRRALLACGSLRIDLHARDSFPDLLQDVLVISGTVGGGRGRGSVEFREHSPSGIASWSHAVTPEAVSWMPYLMDDGQLAAFREASSLQGMVPLGDVASVVVSNVTGANGFFTVPTSVVDEFSMREWALPLLSKASHSPGLVFGEDDWRRCESAGRRAWLLDFQGAPADELTGYLALGEAAGLPGRYKCRIRDPWYVVPKPARGAVMLAKRANISHRLVLNSASVYTTDTIYRGDMLPGAPCTAGDLVATFCNSVTALSAEVWGRCYGGGVLEMIPSGIARLAVPVVSGAVSSLANLDARYRAGAGIEAGADETVCRLIPGFSRLLPAVRSAVSRLRALRISGV